MLQLNSVLLYVSIFAPSLFVANLTAFNGQTDQDAFEGCSSAGLYSSFDLICLCTVLALFWKAVHDKVVQVLLRLHNWTGGRLAFLFRIL